MAFFPILNPLKYAEKGMTGTIFDAKPQKYLHGVICHICHKIKELFLVYRIFFENFTFLLFTFSGGSALIVYIL